MLAPDRKKAVTLIIGSMKPDFVQRMGDASNNGVRMPEESASDYSMAMEDCGRKIMSALERKDVKAFVNYMSELVYMCDEQEDASEGAMDM